jgi:tetratricopeptide (TPR) repeat protein
MHPRQRSRFIDELVRELSFATSDFEHIGYRFMDKFHPAAWDHRGTNIAGFPVKSTVDSAAGSVAKAAQYNSEQTFFSDEKSKKFKDDIEGVVQKHSSVKHIWVLSNRLATGGEMTRARNVAAGYLPATVELLDARQVASFIVDNLQDHKFVESLAVYLPFLRKLKSEWALSHQTPKIEGYVSRPGDEAAIKAALRAHPIVTIAGVSGLGKSALASCVADEMYSEGDYELVLWQDGRTIKQVEDLRAVEVDGYGRRENLLGYLKANKCLLVLDNLVVDNLLAEIAAQGAPWTRILATSQAETGGGEIYKLCEVDEATSRAILTRGLSDCPNDIFTAVYSSVGGHPLLLTILRNEVAKAGGDWSRAARLSAAPHALIDERREKVCDRVLEQHQKVLATEFAFMSWCNAPVLDATLLTAACGPASADSLQARHFVAPNIDGTIRINDLVLRSIRTVARHSSADGEEFLESLTRYVERAANDRTERLVLLRIARMHRDLFRALLAGKASPRQHAALRYLLAAAWNERGDLELLGNPLEDAKQLLNDASGEGDDIRVRAIIESVETAYWQTAFRDNSKQAQKKLEALLPTFDYLGQNARLPPELRRDVEFHQAKAWSWCGRTDAAEAAFRKILDEKPNEAATHLQLGKLLARRARGKAGSDLDATIAAFEAIIGQPPSEVATTVALDAFGLLAQVGPASGLALLLRHRDRLQQELRSALSKGLAQPYDIVAKLTGAFWYHAGDDLDSLYATIAGQPAPAERDDDIFAWAQAQKQYAKNEFERGTPSEAVVPRLKSAIATYEQILKPRAWQPVQFAECLILAGEHKRALSILEAPGVERSCHWHHRRAQALRGIGNLSEARNEIDAALANAEQKYKAAFLLERYEILEKDGDPSARADLQRAHDECEVGKFKNELALRLADRGE